MGPISLAETMLLVAFAIAAALVLWRYTAAIESYLQRRPVLQIVSTEAGHVRPRETIPDS